MKSYTSNFFLGLVVMFSGCLANDNYQEAIDRVNACADPSLVEVTEVDLDENNNFFVGQLAGESISVKTGFLDYYMQIVREFVYVTPGPSAPPDIATSFNRVTLFLTREIASESSPQGNHLFSIEINLPCNEDTEVDELTFFEDALEEGRSYPILASGGNCEEEVTVTIRILCYSYQNSREGGYISSPLTSRNGRQTGRRFTVEKYEVSETEDGNIHVKLRANFSANLLTATSAGIVNFGTLEAATIDFDGDVY